jgi:hypothetical protein
MAIMIPATPHSYDRLSLEGLMFDALSELPDDYFVIHSFKIATVESGEYRENEGDFVIFHPQKGIICIEAKAGRIKYENGTWYYGSGLPMAHGGPFRQADNFKWRLIDYIRQKNRDTLISKCKFMHAVWFPSVSKDEINNVNLPSECVREQILTKEALTSPQYYIDKVFDIKLVSSGENVVTNLTNTETQIMIREILCPQFDIVSTPESDLDLKKIVFHHLLEEQTNVLNFLIEQRTAVINGAAGTGKTMIALEKARRDASKCEDVLFLCFNNQLKKFLAACYPSEYIDYYTIGGFACKLCDTSEPDYASLAEVLLEMGGDGSFPYDHVVIDEGQDFGIELIDDSGVMGILKDVVMQDRGNGIKSTFYVFYDNLQLVQARKAPDYINNADCKLTLYRNCRNTINIAKTSLKPITERQPEMIERCIMGTPAVIHYSQSSETTIEVIDKAIEEVRLKGIKDIIILTCKTKEQSVLRDSVNNDLYNGKIRFSTCRRFKGLEADAVILVDVEKSLFEDDNILLFYVGASRARLNLDIIANLSNDDCKSILNNKLHVKGEIKKPMRQFATALNALAK